MNSPPNKYTVINFIHNKGLSPQPRKIKIDAASCTLKTASKAFLIIKVQVRNHRGKQGMSIV